ncbi:MAG: hypothetical protein ACI8RD_010727 [Bacillariaceae sp.]|jgi:hypothetical protein
MNGMFVCNYSGFPLGTATVLTASMLRGIDQENITILQRWNRNHDDYCEEYEIERRVLYDRLVI